MEKSAIYLDHAAACLDIAKRLGRDVEPALIELAKAWWELVEEAMTEATLVPMNDTSNYAAAIRLP